MGVNIFEVSIEGAQPLFGRGARIELAHHVRFGLRRFRHLFLHFAALVPLEQRIAFEFGVDKGLEFHVGHLQQFDGLLQLRRHDQGLALAHIEPLMQCHGGFSPG